MSRTLVVMIALVAVLPVAVILRWQRDLIIPRICPREMLFLDGIEERRRVHGRGVNAFLRHRSTWLGFIAYAVGLTVLSLGLAGLTIAVSRVGQWSGTGVKLAAILCAVIPLHLVHPGFPGCFSCCNGRSIKPCRTAVYNRERNETPEKSGASGNFGIARRKTPR